MMRVFAMLYRLREGRGEPAVPSSARDATASSFLLRVLAYPYAVLRDLAGGQLTLRATGLVYSTLLALIPAFALTFALLKAFGIHRDLAPLIFEFFRPLGANAAVGHHAGDEVRRQRARRPRRHHRLPGAAVDADRHREARRGQLQLRVARAGGAQPAATHRRVCGAAAGRAAAVASVVGFTGATFTGVLTRAAPYAIVTALFTALYIVIPNTRVRLGPALIGALCAGASWAFVGRVFTQFVIYSSRLTLVYAGFAVIVGVLLWTYFGWLILLAGAQLSFYVQNPSYLSLGLAPVSLSNREKERLALNLMVLVARHARANAAPMTLTELAQAAGLPPLAMASVYEALGGARN